MAARTQIRFSALPQFAAKLRELESTLRERRADFGKVPATDKATL